MRSPKMNNNANKQKKNIKPIKVKPNISDKFDKIRLTSEIIVSKMQFRTFVPALPPYLEHINSHQKNHQF